MNANALPLGDRSRTKNRIRSLEDFYADHAEAKKRRQAHQDELFGDDDEEMPSYDTWSVVELTEVTDFPKCIAPYAPEAENLDPEDLDPLPQKFFWMKESNSLSLRPILEYFITTQGNQPIDVKVDPEEKVMIKDGSVIRAIPPKIQLDSRGGGRGGRGGGRGRPPPRGGRGGRGGGRGGFGFGGGRGGFNFGGQDRGRSPPRDRRSMSSRRSPPRRSPERRSHSSRHSPARRSPDRHSYYSRRSPPRRSPDRHFHSSRQSPPRRSPDRHSRSLVRHSSPPRRSPDRQSYSSRRQSPERREYRQEDRGRPSEPRQRRARSPSLSPEPRGRGRELKMPSPPPISLSSSSRRSRNNQPELIDLVDDDSPPRSSRRPSDVSTAPVRRGNRRDSPEEFKPPKNIKKSKDDSCKQS